MNPPVIFDRTRLRANQAKAAANFEKHDFLDRHAAREMVERLSGVKRIFTRGADVGSRNGMMATLLRPAMPGLAMLSLAQTFAHAVRMQPPCAVADEEALPLREGSLDLITSVLSLHLVNDLPGALVQIRRALCPDGFFLAALLGGDSLIELRESFLRAESETSGEVSPRVFPTADVREMGGLLQRAGFALPVVDTEQITVTYADPLALMRELKAMGAANPLAARSRKPLRRATLARALQIYSERHFTGERVRATFEILYLSGWAPHESQQKPLKPGSAAARLADALGTKEIPAGDKAAFPKKS